MRQLTTTVAGLYLYPVKSARGIRVNRLEFDSKGPRHDHRRMIVDAGTGMFVAQRQDGPGIAIPEMSQIVTGIKGDQLFLNAPGMDELVLPLDGRTPDARMDYPRAVSIWEDVTAGVDQGRVANEWCTRYLSQFRRSHYRLVYMPDSVKRFSKDGLGLVGYTDAWSTLVGSAGSLRHLNEQIAVTRILREEPAEPVLDWDRFRPTIVLDSDQEYIEDQAVVMTIGDVVFAGKTRCKRCITTTTNQATSKRGVEPLRTLARIRRNPDQEAGGVVFLRNFSHGSTGTITVGDKAVLLAAD